MTKSGDILWKPSAARQSASLMGAFAARVSASTARELTDYWALHRWSVAEPGAFWRAVAEDGGVQFHQPARVDYVPPPAGKLRGAQFFPGATLNYAAELLKGDPQRVALVALAEGRARQEYSLGELQRQVAACAAALAACGVTAGDRVAGVLANLPEAIIAMLATASLGAVWSSCSPDFGVAGIADRLCQVDPKVVFFTRAYQYAGKHFDCLETATAVLSRLGHVAQAVLVPHLDQAVPEAAGFVTWANFLAAQAQAPLRFVWRDVADPLFIMFSSGTTGTPKCIVHSIGGTLLQHLKELRLHSDVGPGSRLMFYTTCGWMMWNWMVSGLAAGATLVLFEGAVNTPNLGVLWRTVRQERVTAFGTSPKFVSACMSAGLSPRAELQGYELRTLLSTGAPLLPEHFAWLYAEAAPADGDLHVASISGGTDILSCFMLGTPLLPVRAGEIQAPGLGMAIAAWDDQRRPVIGAKGELVCTHPFASMPIGFWDDPDGERYRQAYFAHYVGDGAEVWRHGDFIEVTAAGGIVVYGRSDATLNPGGVRIGSAELYRQVEAVPEVTDSLALGLRQDGDEHIILFVKLRTGVTLDTVMVAKIKTQIRRGLTPRHVPRDILAVNDIPYTRSGKKVELAASQTVHGEPVPNLAAIANPEALEAFAVHGRKLRGLAEA